MLIALTVIKKFRKLMAIMFQSLYEMVPFLTLLLIMVSVFGVMKLINASTDGKEPELIFVQYVFEQYRILFGENPSLGSYSSNAMYILFTLFVNILLLNLLIAIIGNTFEKVMTEQNSEDLRSLCYSLIEYAQFTRFFYKKGCCKQKKSEPLYLHYLGHIRDGGEQANLDDAWVGRVKLIQNDLNDA